MTLKQVVMVQRMVQEMAQRPRVVESQDRCNIRRLGLSGVVKRMVQGMVKIFFSAEGGPRSRAGRNGRELAPASCCADRNRYLDPVLVSGGWRAT